MIYIEDYMNSRPNWREEFAAAPYFIKVKEDGEYILLQYSQLESDFSNEMVQQARGIILRNTVIAEEVGEEWTCVCRPFNKFHNIQEDLAAPIDWTTACVQEKIDGSLMKLWYDLGRWHLSTNGCVDAFKAMLGDTDVSFGDIFLRAAGVRSINEFAARFDPDYTYLFELTSPETRLVIPYDDGVYFLAKKETFTGNEAKIPINELPPSVKHPRLYPISDPNGAIEAAAAMTQDEEGFVVVDANLNRVKIKSLAWLEAHRAYNNGNVSIRTLIDFIREEKIDDLLALAPSYREKVEDIKKFLSIYQDALDHAINHYYWWKKEHPEATAAEEAIYISLKHHSDFVFKYLKRDMSSHDYIYSYLKTCTLVDLYKAYKGEKL